MSYHWAYASAYATHMFAYAVHVEQEGLTQTLRDACFAQNAADNASLRAAYFVQWTFTTPNLRIWMLKKHLRMRTKKKARRQKQPSSSSSSSRLAADLQQQQTSGSRPAAAAAAGSGEVEVEG